jgi:hypothetical protein
MGKKGELTDYQRHKGAKASLEKRYAHLKELEQVPKVIEIKTIADACSPHVIEYSREFLINGGRWDELRAHLGLGPSNVDRRWRKLREAVIEAMVPKSREQALLGQASVRHFLISELDSFSEELEKVMPSISEKNLHHYYKMKFEALRAKLDENSRGFDAFTQIEQIKSKEKHNQGTSIIVQNNYHINRPGDVPVKKAEEIDVTDSD